MPGVTAATMYWMSRSMSMPVSRLELFLPLLLHRHHFLDAQAELRIHDRADVGVGDDGRVRGDIPQLDRSGGGGKRLKSAAVVGDEPCAQPGNQHSG